MDGRFMACSLLMVFVLVGAAIYAGGQRHECYCGANMWDRGAKKCLMSRPQPYCTIWNQQNGKTNHLQEG